MWEVYWYSSTGEDCVETFDNERDAQAFIEFNDWQKNEHPKLRKIGQE